MSNFDSLSDILGPELTLRVIQKLGGRILRVRKRVSFVNREFEQQVVGVLKISSRKLAKKLDCSMDYARKLKDWYAKNRQTSIYKKKHSVPRAKLFRLIKDEEVGPKLYDASRRGKARSLARRLGIWNGD